MNSKSKLSSIARFTRAGSAMGNIQVNRARDEFDSTGHSCYKEGWAAGYLAAMEVVERFVADTIAEVNTNER